MKEQPKVLSAFIIIIVAQIMNVVNRARATARAKG